MCSAAEAAVIERVCRIGAVLIAVAAVIDPVWGRATTARPELLVTQAPGATAGDVDRVREALASRFQLADAPTPATAATVLIGRTPPAVVPDSRVFAVTTTASAAAPEIRRVDVAPVSSLDSAAEVRVQVAPASGATAPTDVWLESQGVVLDRQTLNEGGATATGDVVLTFVPSRAGLAHLRVGARAGNGPATFADAATEVVRRTRRVLVYEARPSWAATFIRRALEQDSRLSVDARSQVSRGIGAAAGAPPASLQSLDALTMFDVIVIGAPEGLADRDAAVLEQYLREREGSVILLPDQGSASGALARLTGAAQWDVERRPQLQTVTAGAFQWTASEFVWPRRWPVGAEAMTSCAEPGRRCAVWRVPVGGGRVVVSSAVDAWRTRAADASTFEAFWRAVAVDEASLTPEPVSASLSAALVEPGAPMAATIRVLRPGDVSARLENVDGVRQSVRLWPAGDRTFEAEWRAPLTPGRYRLALTQPGDEGAATREFLVVEKSALAPPLPSTNTTLAALASARGGVAVPLDELPVLADRLAGALEPPLETSPLAPMRSPWWIVPFAGLLSVEWWSRRRRGAR